MSTLRWKYELIIGKLGELHWTGEMVTTKKKSWKGCSLVTVLRKHCVNTFIKSNKPPNIPVICSSTIFLKLLHFLTRNNDCKLFSQPFNPEVANEIFSDAYKYNIISFLFLIAKSVPYRNRNDTSIYLLGIKVLKDSYLKD